MTLSPEHLEKQAAQLRRLIFTTICEGGGGHIASCLSSAEIITVLYHNILRLTPATADHPDRDRFILSKGHACVALYAVLAELGFIDHELLATYGRKDTVLGGHPDMHKIPGVEASTGSLGHGFPFGTGMALAGKLDRRDYRVFMLLGDGECQEGSIWETAMFAAQHRLDNLTTVIDYNKLQALDRLEAIVGLEPLAEKWAAFGWEVRQTDGHDVRPLQEHLESVPWQSGRPSLLIAHTVKGKGISFMENTPIWHYRLPNPEETEIARRDLDFDDAVAR